jgi:hypothetical protein
VEKNADPGNATPVSKLRPKAGLFRKPLPLPDAVAAAEPESSDEVLRPIKLTTARHTGKNCPTLAHYKSKSLTPNRIVILLALHLAFSAQLSQANETSTRRCSSAQSYTARLDFYFLKQRLTSLLKPGTGLPSYDLEKVKRVYIDKLQNPTTNPYTNKIPGYYNLIHKRLVSGINRIQSYVSETPVTIKCETAQHPDCASSATAFVEMDDKFDIAADSVIHLCPAYFQFESSSTRIGTLGHELSHQVLNTTHQGPRVVDPRSYPNLASDAFVYGRLFGSNDLEVELRYTIWAYFWFNDRSSKPAQ